MGAGQVGDFTPGRSSVHSPVYVHVRLLVRGPPAVRPASRGSAGEARFGSLWRGARRAGLAGDRGRDQVRVAAAAAPRVALRPDRGRAVRWAASGDRLLALN